MTTERYENSLIDYDKDVRAALQNGPEGKAALKARGCPDAIIETCGYAVNKRLRNLELLKAVDFDRHIIFPQRRHGRLIGFQAWDHKATGDEKKYLKQTGLTQQLWGATNGKTVVVVEGPQDEWTLRAAGIPCLCAGGTAIRQDDLAWLRTFAKLCDDFHRRAIY